MYAVKQVIVVNEALNLPPGKLAAQVAHAAVGALVGAEPALQRAWFENGMPKIVLRCGSEATLLAILEQAQAAGLPSLLIRDAGRTVVQAGTATCVGIGPELAEKIDVVTGKLNLLP
jgi:peptidyl-tRNA hydrolase, PTH2 family